MAREAAARHRRLTIRLKWTGIALLAFALSAQAQEATHDWTKAQKLSDDIAYTHADLVLDPAGDLRCPYYLGFSPEKPRKLRLHVLRIDTRNPTLHLAVTGRAEGWGSPMPDHAGEKYEEFTIRTRRETTAQFMQRSRATSRDMLVALNAQPWSPFKSRVATPYADRLGLLISDGVLVSPANGRPSLIIDKRGRLDMMITNDKTDLAGVELAVTGFSFCLVDGEPIKPDNTLHPRTGYGLCREKRFLFLLVIDGRQHASQGATVSEVGQWLRHYGAHTGINMDGGGSTTMARWDPDKKHVEILNRPSGGRPRSTGSNLGVFRQAVDSNTTPSPLEAGVKVRGQRATWHPITLDIAGPESSETASPNPFTDYRLVVRFSHAEGSHTVPGYFAADGNAANTGATAGDVWRVHFVPDRPGQWRYHVSMRRATNIVFDVNPEAGEAVRGDGASGSLEIAADDDEPGQLRYTGERYLRFAGSGRHFIKGGAGSPENFLAYDDFDGHDFNEHAKGPETAGPDRKGEAARAPRHRYQPHVKDWKDGDPVWRGDRGKGIIGALNYLASKGMNSVYFLTMNVQGDGDDVWPYVTMNERYRFDCSKLGQWEIVFSHMDRLGILLHVILTETENESLFEIEEGAEFARSRKLYYRELIARFSHHRALVWNIGEENGWEDRKRGNSGRANTHDQRKAFASYIREVDPWNHAVVVHTLTERYDEIYKPLLGHRAYEGPSLQVTLGPRIHEETKNWIDRSARAGRQWVVTLDEIGPPEDGVKPDADDPNHDDVRHHALWGTLMAGGAGCEWYFGFKFAHNDLGLEDFRSRDRMWNQTRHAIEFFQKHLPFAEMRAADDLLSGGAYCFASPGRVWAVYLPPASDLTATRLRLPEGHFRIRWYDPRRGGDLQKGTKPSVRGAGNRSLGEPPREKTRDWVVLITPSE